MARDFDALTPAQIAEKALAVGAGKADMPLRKSFVLACAAGVFIGLGATFMLMVKADATLSFVASQLLGGLVFSLGLYLVVTAGAELFTGNCLMVMGRLSGRYSWGRLLKSWAVVYLGNLVGSLVLVLILFLADFSAMGSGAVGEAMVRVAAGKCALGWSELFFRGVMCNVLVCLAVWCSFAARSLADKLLSVLMPVMAFVACGFEHCVANMFFLPMGYVALSSGIAVEGLDTSVLGMGGILWNLSAATLGNIVGGAILVGCTYWLAFLRKR